MSNALEQHAVNFYRAYHAASDILRSIDTGNIDALIAGMERDVSVNISGSVLSGSAQVGEALAAAHAEAVSMRHMINNLRVTGSDNQHVSVEYTVLVAQVTGQGSTLSTCDYHDQYVNGPDGSLKLKARKIDLITRFDAKSLL